MEAKKETNQELQVRLQNLENKANKTRKIANRPIFHELTADLYTKMFTAFANIRISRGFRQSNFKIDENKEVLRQLYYYLKWDDRFNGNLRAGILLLGDLGPGKSLIMGSFCDLWNEVVKSREQSHIVINDHADAIRNIYSKTFFDMVMNKDCKAEVEKCLRSFLYIDDIGKEESFGVDFGSAKRPMTDLLEYKYAKKMPMFASGNYSLEDLEDHYGETITDRMKEMFNIIVLEGTSKR